MKELKQKIRHFEKQFCFPLVSVERAVKWPIKHDRGNSYNPDYFCPQLDFYIELVTSYTCISESRIKWRDTILAGYRLRILWWENSYEMTYDILNGATQGVIKARIEAMKTERSA